MTMTNEELELQALEAEIAALEEAEKVEEAPKPKRKSRAKKAEPAAPAAPTPPEPVAAPMPEPEVAYAPVIQKTRTVRPAKSQGDSSRGIRRRFR